MEHKIPLELLPGWLFGVEGNRLKVELKEKISRYPRECFKVLWQAFQTETTDSNKSLVSSSSETYLSVTENSIEVFEDYEAGIDESMVERAPTEEQLELVQIREMGMAITRMADQQLATDRKADRAHERLDKAKEYLQRLQTRFDQRMTALEDRINPPEEYILEEQVTQLQLEIKALAELLTSRKPADQDRRKNHYQGIFNELYRRYNVSSYSRVRISQYTTLMQFLTDWKQAIYNNISSEVFLQGKLLK